MKHKQKQRLNSDERKQAMIAAARELFMEKGFGATSLDDVVSRSGGSLATLYQLFGNKEGLWRELVKAFCDRLTEPFAQAIDGDSPRTVLRAAAERLLSMKLGAEDLAGMRILMTEGGKNPDLVSLLYDNGPRAGQKTVSDYLRRQTEVGTLDVDDPDLAALLFLHSVVGEFTMWRCCGVHDQMDAKATSRYIDAAVDMFLARYEKKN